MGFLEKFTEYGLLGLVVGAMIFLLYKIVIWTLGVHKELLGQMAAERASWQNAVNEVTNSIKKHDEKADERGRYVREEHKQMIEALGRINGFTHEASR